jgi:hypothetical protein
MILLHCTPAALPCIAQPSLMATRMIVDLMHAPDLNDLADALEN